MFFLMRAVADAATSGVNKKVTQTFVKLSESQHLLCMSASCYRCGDDMREEKVRGDSESRKISLRVQLATGGKEKKNL